MILLLRVLQELIQDIKLQIALHVPRVMNAWIHVMVQLPVLQEVTVLGEHPVVLHVQVVATVLIQVLVLYRVCPVTTQQVVLSYALNVKPEDIVLTKDPHLPVHLELILYRNLNPVKYVPLGIFVPHHHY